MFPKLVIAMVVAVLPLLVGCANSPRSVSAQRFRADVQPSLVLPSEPMLELAAAKNDIGDPRLDPYGWAFSRNDDQLGSAPGTDLPTIQFVEVRQRDYLRTINGRPREFSTTITTSVKRGVTR